MGQHRLSEKTEERLQNYLLAKRNEIPRDVSGRPKYSSWTYEDIIRLLLHQAGF
ncbi:MAG: hypothetical protein QXL94_04425 [Candidatus Parvarchaeum sp.]